MPKRIDETQPKQCTKCNVIKESEEFGKGIQRADGTFGLAGKCRKCRVAESRKYFKMNPEKRKKASKRYQEKIDKRRREDPIYIMQSRIYKSNGTARKEGHIPCLVTANELFESFTGKCFVCGVSEIECGKKMQMDHCHKTGKFRGWLCGKCNRAAGLLMESHEVSLKLSEYLRDA